MNVRYIAIIVPICCAMLVLQSRGMDVDPDDRTGEIGNKVFALGPDALTRDLHVRRDGTEDIVLSEPRELLKFDTFPKNIEAKCGDTGAWIKPLMNIDQRLELHDFLLNLHLKKDQMFKIQMVVELGCNTDREPMITFYTFSAPAIRGVYWNDRGYHGRPADMKEFSDDLDTAIEMRRNLIAHQAKRTAN